MNRLSSRDRTQVLHLLWEGNSIHAAVRLTGASRNTIAKLLVDAGQACADYHDRHVQGVRAKRVLVDEIWSFTHCRQKNDATAKAAPDDAGDVWTWSAIDADTKLVISYLVGGRDADYGKAFMLDVAERLNGRVRLTSDGHKPYLEAVEDAFGADVDYAVLQTVYGAALEAAKDGYSPPAGTWAHKRRVEGQPDEKYVSTSYVERQNLTMRMHMRRFTRLTNTFSKKVENHAHAVALHFMYHNFVRVHKTLRMTPAMAAGVTDRFWEVADIVKLLEAREAEQPKVRGLYGKHGSRNST